MGAAFGFSLWQTPVYEASAKVLVGQEQAADDQQDRDSLNSSVQGLQQITQTMVEAIKSRPVAEEAVELLKLQTTPTELLGNLNVEQVGSTQFIRLSYRDTDPERARHVVDSIAVLSSGRISEANASAGAIRATVWEYATVPAAPVSPNTARAVLLALGLGIMFGLGMALLLEYLDGSWRSPEDVEQASGLPNLGVIPRFDTVKSRKQEAS
jgi:capsular polysaccharide biosynthesis protein